MLSLMAQKVPSPPPGDRAHLEESAPPPPPPPPPTHTHTHTNTHTHTRARANEKAQPPENILLRKKIRLKMYFTIFYFTSGC